MMRRIISATTIRGALSAALLRGGASAASSRHFLGSSGIRHGGDGAADVAAAFSFRRRSSSLRPSSQHPLLPLPDPPDYDGDMTSPWDVRGAFLESNVGRVAFVRHGNTAPADADFDRALTDLGRSQSAAAGASYGANELYPYFEKAALCSSAPRCAETARLFLDATAKELMKGLTDEDSTSFAMPTLELDSNLYDGTMQPEGSRLFRSIGYAPLREYLENSDGDDAEAARSVLGGYARSSLDAIWNVLTASSSSSEKAGATAAGDGSGGDDNSGRTLLFFAHAIYLPAAALGLAAAIGCESGGGKESNDDGRAVGRMDLMLDTNTREAEGYCVHVDTRRVSLLQLPHEQ